MRTAVIAPATPESPRGGRGTPLLQQETHGGVVLLRLNRPSARNALNRALIDALDAALQKADADAATRVIVLAGAGPHFCAGADVADMQAMDDESAERLGLTGSSRFLSHVGVPVVAAVQGVAAGGGCELVEMCDIVIAAESASFLHPELRLAAMPGAGGTLRLPRVVGKHVAMDMLLSGRALSATHALQAGLVSRVVEGDDAVPAAMALAQGIAALSAPVVRRLKRAALAALEPCDHHLDEERRAFHACFRERDFREGLAAFLDRRPPVFNAAG